MDHSHLPDIYSSLALETTYSLGFSPTLLLLLGFCIQFLLSSQTQECRCQSLVLSSHSSFTSAAILSNSEILNSLYMLCVSNVCLPPCRCLSQSQDLPFPFGCLICRSTSAYPNLNLHSYFLDLSIHSLL